MVRSSKIQREVLTLAEAARHLRLTAKDVEDLAARGVLPGRCVNRKWRFLRAALDDWLRAPNYKAALLQRAGAFADDASLPQLLESIYARRGRPEVDGNKH
jgi:excisionase family DNA binding protein